MKKAFLFFIPVLAFTACEKCDDEDGEVCTDEFRMITLTVKSSSMTAITLDSVYTIRQSTNEKITPQQPMAPGIYVVLDDSYHSKLKKTDDNFRFVGWRSNQIVVDQNFRIAGDNCHITKRSGIDSVMVQ